MNSRCPSSAGCQLEGELASLTHPAARLLIIAGKFIRVDPILVSVHCETSLRQEGQVNVEAPRSPICHGADIPITSISSGDYDVVRDFCVEYSGLVPFGRHCRQ